MQDLNLNVDSKTLEACLKTRTMIGYTEYRNICTGQNTQVPWGVTDYLLGAMLVGMIVFFAASIWWIIKD
jgi:hypothetical protein